MNCQDFQRHLAAFVRGNLDNEPHKQCEDHLLTCTECLDSWLIKLKLNERPQYDLVNSVLSQTNTNQCQESEKLLVEYVDAQLGSTDTELVANHLAHCSACKQTADQLILLKHDLPQLRFVEPPPDLVADVLRNTLPWYQLLWKNNFFSNFSFRSLLLRPRFSLEFSFTVTLLWLTVFGLPNNFSSVAIAEQINTASATVREITTEQPANYVRRFESELSQFSPNFEEMDSLGEIGSQFIESTRQRGNSLWRSLTELLPSRQLEN